MPLLMLPVMTQFPAAMVTYWLTTNVYSLIQGPTMKLPAVRRALNIPLLKEHPKKAMPLTAAHEKKGIKESVTSAYKNFKKSKRGVVDRHRLDEERRYKAATDPVPRTFKE